MNNTNKALKQGTFNEIQREYARIDAENANALMQSYAEMLEVIKLMLPHCLISNDGRFGEPITQRSIEHVVSKAEALQFVYKKL